MGTKYQDELAYSLEEKAENLISQLPDFTRSYFSHLSNKNCSERTRIQYAYDLKNFFDWLSTTAGFKDVNLKIATASDIMDKLTKEDLQEYVDTLRHIDVPSGNGKTTRKIASDASRARQVSALRSFYKYYYAVGDINRDVASLIAVPDIRKKEVAILEKDDIIRLLDTVKNEYGYSKQKQAAISLTKKRDYAICMLLFGTGIRVSELVGIDMSDIDFKNASVLLTRKGGDQDITYFGPEVENALLDYINNERDALLGNYCIPALFVSATHKKRLSARTVENMVQNYGKMAGITKKITPHTMRRTYGTNLYDETHDVFLVADALHHASTETAKKYIKMSTENKRLAAKTASKIFEKKI